MVWSRDDSWNRRKGGLVYDANGDQLMAFPTDEKWPRFAAEIPPEIATLLDVEIKRVRLMHGRFTRADAVRSGLRMWLNHHNPERDPNDTIEGTASEIVDLPALEGSSEPPEQRERRAM